MKKMGLLNMMGINLPGFAGQNGPQGSNPFAGLVGGGLPTPPTQMGAGFNSLIPQLVQALTGQLGDPAVQPGVQGVPEVQAVNPLEKGNIDLTKRPVVKNPDGSISTVRSMSFRNNKGQEVLIPTVADDGSRILSDQEAMEQYGRTGKHLGIFASPDEATRYAETLHQDQEKMYAPNTNRPNPYDVSDQQWQDMNRPGEELADTSGSAPSQTPAPVPSGATSATEREYDEYGIPKSYYRSIRAAESGGNDMAKNPLSSASGRYQWTKGTWADMQRKHPELGLTPNGRFSADENERAIKVFTAENANVLKANGLPVHGGTLYASHFLGAGDAPKVWKAPDDMPMSNLVSPAVIQANGFLAGMNAGQFRAWATKKGSGTPALNSGPAYGPTSNEMSRPSGSQSMITEGTAAGGLREGREAPGFSMSEGDFNTALSSKGSGGKGGLGIRGGGGHSESERASGGGVQKNDLSPDYKRYQARKNVRHLRGLSPVATIQALENIGKGLRVNGGGRTS
jgi:hypothetical protein